MLILYFSIIFNILSFTTQKTIISGYIYDSYTKKPIPYSNIYIKNKYGTTSNNIGYFSLKLKDLNNNDTLYFSSLGYIPKKIILSEVRNSNIEIYLTPTSYKINEVNISSEKTNYDIKRLGPKKKRKICNITDNVKLNELPSEIGTIFYPEQKCFLKSVEVYISKTGKYKTKFRVNVYDKNSKTGLPNNNLLKENVFAKANKGNKWISIDLSKYNIKVDTSGFFVFIETINVGDKGLYIQKFKQIDANKKRTNTHIDTSYGARVLQCTTVNDKYQTYTNRFYYENKFWIRTDTYPLIGAYVYYSVEK